MARRPHRIWLEDSVEKFCLDLMLSVLPIIFIWRFHRVAQDQRILDSELDTEVTYHEIIYFSTGPPWFWSLCKVQMRINLFKCSWFCLSPLQRPLCVEGRLGRRKNESARGTWDTRREAQSVKETVDAFRSIQPKLSKIWKQRQMVQTFSGKVSRSSGSCWISKMRTIQSNILEIQGTKMNGKKTSGKFPKIWVYLERFSFFLEILPSAVPFATESCRKFKPNVLVEWKLKLPVVLRLGLVKCVVRFGCAFTR